MLCSPVWSPVFVFSCSSWLCYDVGGAWMALGARIPLPVGTEMCVWVRGYLVQFVRREASLQRGVNSLETAYLCSGWWYVLPCFPLIALGGCGILEGGCAFCRAVKCCISVCLDPCLCSLQEGRFRILPSTVAAIFHLQIEEKMTNHILSQKLCICQKCIIKSFILYSQQLALSLKFVFNLFFQTLNFQISLLFLNRAIFIYYTFIYEQNCT